MKRLEVVVLIAVLVVLVVGGVMHHISLFARDNFAISVVEAISEGRRPAAISPAAWKVCEPLAMALEKNPDIKLVADFNSNRVVIQGKEDYCFQYCLTLAPASDGLFTRKWQVAKAKGEHPIECTIWERHRQPDATFLYFPASQTFGIANGEDAVEVPMVTFGEVLANQVFGHVYEDDQRPRLVTVYAGISRLDPFKDFDGWSAPVVIRVMMTEDDQFLIEIGAARKKLANGSTTDYRITVHRDIGRKEWVKIQKELDSYSPGLGKLLWPIGMAATIGKA